MMHVVKFDIIFGLFEPQIKTLPSVLLPYTSLVALN